MCLGIIGSIYISMKIKRILAAILPIIMLIAEIFPGAILNFTVPTDTGTETVKMTYSYFDITPAEYSNFGPVFCAALTVLLALCVAVAFFTGSKKFGRAAKISAILTFVFSLLPIAFGADWLSPVGVAISLLAAAEIFLTESAF